MYMMMDAYSKAITAVYFILAVVICAFFLINLTIAIMLKNYDEQDKNIQNTSHQASLIEMGMKSKLPSRLIYFIVTEENLIVNKKAKHKLQDEAEKMGIKQRLITSFIYTKIDVPKEGYYKSKITQFFYFLVNVPFFGSIIMLCILLNTIFLSLERYPMPADEQNAYEKINYLFTSIFTIEVILKLIGQSPRKFISDRFNIFDTIIVLISISELFISSGSGGVTALRAFRLFRILKLFRHGNLRILLDSIAYTMSTIGNYVILLGLFIYVYSLLGMQFFAGKMTYDNEGYYDPNGKRSRANFDTLFWSAITVFQVLIGDNWNDVMFNCVKSVGVGARFYFISLILFGTIVMLNLFLAILLGNFDKARSFWLKKGIFEMFETAIHKKISLSNAINIILGEVTKSVREELLVHDPHDIFRINGKLIIINKKLFENDLENEKKMLYYERVAVYEKDYTPIVEIPENNRMDDEDIENYQDSDRDENNSPDDSKKHNKKGNSPLTKTFIDDVLPKIDRHPHYDNGHPDYNSVSKYLFKHFLGLSCRSQNQLQTYSRLS